MSERLEPVRWTRMVALDQRLYGFPDRIFARHRGRLRDLLSAEPAPDGSFREYRTEGLNVCSFVTADLAGPLIFVVGIRPPETLWNWSSAGYWMRRSAELTEKILQTPRLPWQPPDLLAVEQGDGLTLARYRGLSNEEREAYRLHELYASLSAQLAEHQGNDGTRQASASDPGFP